MHVAELGRVTSKVEEMRSAGAAAPPHETPHEQPRLSARAATFQ